MPISINAVIIRNTNGQYGDPIEFSGDTRDDAVAAMQESIRACGAEFADVVVSDDDYEVVSEYGRTPACDYAEERGWALSDLSAVEQLDAANGRRRTRTMDLDDILSCAADLDEDCPIVLVDGGRVANAYKYAATTTAAVLWLMGPFCMVAVREVSAKGGTGFGDLVRKDKRQPGGYRILDIESLAACSTEVA